MLASFLQKEVCRVRVQSWLNMLAYLVNLGITYGSLTGAFGATNEELSEKYQSLVTPAGYAFAIWGAIFTWEGIFAVAQMFPSLSTSPVVDTVTPWWIFACCFQVAWTLFFAQDLIPGSLVCMLGILLSLVTAILRTDFLPEISLKEYFLLRAPFSLHCGWIIAASVLNINVLADYYMSSQETLLMLAMVPWQHVAVVICVFPCVSLCFPFLCLDMGYGYWAHLSTLFNTDPSFQFAVETAMDRHLLYLGLEFVDVLLESDSQVCLAGIAVIVALFTFAAPRADPLIGLVAAWALLGIYVELENPENLLNMNKFNYIAWPQFVIESVRRTALVLSIASACAASIAIFRSGWQRMRASDKSLTSDDATAVIWPASQVQSKSSAAQFIVQCKRLKLSCFKSDAPASTATTSATTWWKQAIDEWRFCQGEPGEKLSAAPDFLLLPLLQRGGGWWMKQKETGKCRILSMGCLEVFGRFYGGSCHS